MKKKQVLFVHFESFVVSFCRRVSGRYLEQLDIGEEGSGIARLGHLFHLCSDQLVDDRASA